MDGVCPALPLELRSSFHVRDDYPIALRDVVEEIYTTQGFYRDLPVIPGAVEAAKSLLEMGHDVRICTSPLNQYRFCLPEKYEWVERHLGTDFMHRMIVTKDKTVVYGDMLVDDKPSVTGARTPHWRHIIFDQPYNRRETGPRITWDSWRTILLEEP